VLPLEGKRSWRRPNTQEERRLGEVEVTMTRRSMSRPGEWGERLHGGGRGGDARYLRERALPPCMTDIKRCTGTFSIKSCTRLSARPPLKLLIHGTVMRTRPCSHDGRSIPSVTASCMFHDLSAQGLRMAGIL